MKELIGTGVALVTPFQKDGSVDFEGLTKLVSHMIDGGMDYLVVLGTTGETATLDAAEQIEVLHHVRKVNEGRLPLVIGMGGNNTAKLLKDIQAANLEGFCAILSASPYYNKPTQEGIYQHYKAVAEASPLPVILYNVPGRTASNITAATTLRLANDFKNIVAIKEASADMDQVMEIIGNKPAEFLVISGEDGLTFPITAAGGSGVISVVANAYPKAFSEMVRNTLKGNLEEAKKTHYQLKHFIDLIFAEGNPGGIKAALQIMHICEDNLRLPLWKVSEELKSKLKSEIEKIS